MHILIIPSYYPSPAQPLTGTFIEKQAQALRKAGHKVGVLVTPRINVTWEHIKREGLASIRTVTVDANEPNYSVYRMHWGWFPRVLPVAVTFLLRRAGFAAFERYCRAHGKPDVLYPHNTFYGGYLAAQIQVHYGVPAILLEHSSSFLEGLVIFPGQGQIVRDVLRSMDARFSVGKALIPALHKYAPEVEIDVLGNVIDTDLFVPSSTTPSPLPFIFTVIAQLKERRKGFEILIDGFYQAFAGDDTVKLYIRGSGPLQPEIEAHIARLNLGSQVEFLPYMTLEQLRDLIQRSHVIVSSSHVETFAVSVAEAMACGKPVVSTISGGPEDYVNDASGFLVPPGNRQALASAMQQIRTEYARFDPQTIRQICVDRFSEEALVRRLEQAYARIRKRS
ncbi:MAG: glycosyltransferase [Anaerolineae bacterium]|nr:glycosyltransferase [Anaerolineae bacterium]